MNDYTPEKQPQRVPNPPNAQKEGNVVSVNSAELSAYNPRDTHPYSTPKEHLPPIHCIPNEILLHIIHIFVKDSTYPVRDLSSLTLVCQCWRAIVEDASSLWGRIDASEGLASVRKGLRLAKGAALYITYIQEQSITDQLAFFKAIGERIGQWRSLVVEANQAEHCTAILKTTVPPRLKKLHLSGDYDSRGTSLDRSLILFGGAAAPPGLKDVHLENFPIAVAPLKLACLTSLHLGDINYLSISELLQILDDSPALETLTLRFMEDLVPNAALNLPPGWTIQLPSLSHLSLVDLSVPFTHFLLSALAAPHLQKLHVECYMEGIPSPQLLNDDLVRLVPTLKSLISTASEIKVTIVGDSGYEILAGGLEIGVGLWDDAIRHFQDSCEWLSNHLGGYLRNPPTHLHIDICNSNVACLEWFTSRAVVTKLTLWSSSSAWNLRTGIEGIVSLLSHPIPSSPTCWYLPSVEILVTNLVWENGASPEIVEMVQRRHSANREQCEGGLGVPKRFKEFRLSCPNPVIRGPLGPNIEFLKAVDTAGEGAEVFWEGKKWTGTGLED